ncbi:MAG: hypothetical protein ACK5Q2_16155 [Bacteroidota bacterium]
MMMPGTQSHYTSLFTTISGLIGGLGKAITYKPMLASITLTGLSTVATYAALSAMVGYVVKYGMDRVAVRLRKCSQGVKKEDQV